MVFLLTAALTRAASNPPATPPPLVGAITTSAPNSNSNGTEKGENEWRFVGRLSLQATHDANISIRPTDEIDDEVFHVAPSLAYGIGNSARPSRPMRRFRILSPAPAKKISRGGTTRSSAILRMPFFSTITMTRTP